MSRVLEFNERFRYLPQFGLKWGLEEACSRFTYRPSSELTTNFLHLAMSERALNLTPQKERLRWR